jgi:hypothetical protein
MKKENIAILMKVGVLRKRQIDKEKILSMVKSAETNATVAKTVKINEDGATLVFREIYESIRQLGDACWWSEGYEPTNHDISLDALKELDIKEKLKLNFLDRFKQIRHDVNYRGFRASVTQANEILEFWDSCSKDIIKIIMSKLPK